MNAAGVVGGAGLAAVLGWAPLSWLVPLWWGSALLSGGCAAAGVLALGRPGGRGVRRRARWLVPSEEPAAAGERGWWAARFFRRMGARAGVRSRADVRARLEDRRLREAAASLAALAFGAVVLGGVFGWFVGVAGALGVRRLLRSRSARGGGAEEAESRRAAAQLPLAADLLAACLAAGSAPGRAAEAVGQALGGPLGERLVRVATELGLGSEPGAAWRPFAALPGGAGLARCMERAAAGGAPAVDPVTRLAAQLRADGARESAARARRAAVLVTGPLGLCFLPAFLAVGVAPVVIGLAGALR
ncbi:type II secretion system F family protein [Streptomyces sp. ODS28]|uniref:type II secretion system F family protein n=1 Tax=Streptomyces sp. ODS28 TaxID=3136688 RepID=UPI0031ECFBFC